MSHDGYLLTAQAIAAMAGTAKTHFLNPNAQRINKSLGDATGLTGIGVHIIEVEPGRDTTEYHVHHFEDECVYILSGQAVSIIDSEERTVTAGDFIGYRKGGHAHGLRNDGPDLLRVLVIGQRLAHDVGDYPNKGKRIYRNEALEWDYVDHSAIKNP
ncbi:cupin domain-containing protein [Falsiruegeria mediterranea]|uniref:Cupin type-2 domain-containing protein n=1 Tax=Falsiruegeria mediterranea M17 TaxID=1200281 RepID=A0A2R8C827_9RHOB|nr:cupin domain-containing protein [Falsiruegeria mediterranea]SPJ28590.1 hypothetical protein TRM7615_02092 [Falsiruegeria mediterranea M17]